MSEPFITRLQAVAESQPNACALDCPATAQRLSYRSLWVAVAATAETLKENGVGPRSVVALNMPRSIEWVVAMLATWRAGAAWSPIPPELPPQRQRVLLKASGAIAALTRNGAPGLPIPALSFSMSPGAAQSSIPPDLRIDRLAYVICTSGSTGAPKAVAVGHQGLTAMLDAQIEAFELTEQTRSLWLLSPAFDASISDVGTALLCGGTLCVAPKDTESDPKRLLALLADRDISYIDLPSALLTRIDPSRLPPSVQTVIVGGAPSDPAVLRSWASRVRTFNVYGPTEATVCSSLCAVDARTWRAPLLGQPIAGMKYRLGAPNGADGYELEISGPGLAQNYRGDPELTARRFRTDATGRWYRSGDVVRMRGKEYEFVGRTDRQVKLAGRLLAPEEVEAVLQSVDDVGRAVVLPFDDATRPHLVACLEASPALQKTVESTLRNTVPAWMRPTRFWWCSKLPTTTSGKPDYAVIRAHFQTPVAPHGDAPKDTERRLLGITRAVLGIPQLHPDDDLLEAGLDSLGILDLTAAASRHGFDLGPESVRKGRTVRGIFESTRSAHFPERIEANVLTQDVRHFPALARPAAVTANEEPKSILITGPNGFLGARIVSTLMQRTRANLICLMRGTRDNRPAQRLGAALGWAPGDTRWGRLRVVPGDLGQDRLGLDTMIWQELSREIDSIFHLGADLNLVKTYEELRACNVDGTYEVLRLATQAQLKPVHYASSLSVFVSTDRDAGIAMECDTLNATKAVFGGYAQSKFAAEALIRDSGIPVHIYRLGHLTAASDDARLPKNHPLRRMIAAWCRLGVSPEPVPPGIAFDLTPVDHAANAMVHIALASAGPACFHIAGATPVPLSELIGAVDRGHKPLQRIPLEQWRPLAARKSAWLALGLDERQPPRRRAARLGQASLIRFDTSAAQRLNVHAPALDRGLLARTIKRTCEEEGIR